MAIMTCRGAQLRRVQDRRRRRALGLCLRRLHVGKVFSRIVLLPFDPVDCFRRRVQRRRVALDERRRVMGEDGIGRESGVGD